MRLRLTCVAAFALTACGPDPGTVEAEIRHFANAYVTTTDIEASVSMLDPAGTVTSVSGEGRITRGRDAIREQANQNAALLRQLSTTVGQIEIHRLGAADALVIAPFSVSLKAVPQLTVADGAATLFVTRRDSGWKVVHEHYSYSAGRRP